MNTTHTRSDLINALVATAQSLPLTQLEEALDFVGYLQTKKQPSAMPAPGSAEALLRHAGAAHFEPGELAQRLTEIQAQRDLEVAAHA